jgi:hypothetical protein
MQMRMFLLSALFALGVGLAGMPGAGAAPLAAGLDGAPNASLIQQAQVIIVDPYRRRCRSVRRCWINDYGHRRCRWERICRRYW